MFSLIPTFPYFPPAISRCYWNPQPTVIAHSAPACDSESFLYFLLKSWSEITNKSIPPHCQATLDGPKLTFGMASTKEVICTRVVDKGKNLRLRHSEVSIVSSHAYLTTLFSV